MHSDEPHESNSQSVEDGVQARSRAPIVRKTLCAGGLVCVLISALSLAPSDPFADVCGVSLLHMFLATLCASVLFLNSSGPNVVANHGGLGVLVGLVISFIFITPTKAGMIFFLFGAFPGVMFGLIIGVVRGSIAETKTRDANTSVTEQKGDHVDETE